MQSTSNILMIRPVNFSFNAETAVNNAFQVKGQDLDAQNKARKEFDGFVTKLQHHGINVLVVNDTPEPYTPDSIFPNNWVSFHEDGTVILYPMFAANRRAERKQHVLDNIYLRFTKHKLIDLTAGEASNHFLEGTGSMVLDRENRIAYACLSPRTDKKLVEEFCTRMHYSPVTFFARDQKGQEIYHTNVMMCVADKYVVICLASITDEADKARVLKAIKDSNKAVIDITPGQMNSFAGNMLQVQNNEGETYLVMSSQAFHSLTAAQVKELEAYNQIIHSDISTIETNGGGSARCMMAEIFLPEQSSL
ncbi:citrulline utilization hydrolase CtlX [Flavihumibacter profundi]|uniref:citrulline utilization hydrolase CtlX n=1 Tax=Flavihumibacter profundi TaxID=2716883 RepID=UPI001CC7570B|nr:arginine deiminase-related protein [Flavihumibacter profundi]MBZ5856378.1 amidinotransferase [Flavihumibacter profundi]